MTSARFAPSLLHYKPPLLVRKRDQKSVLDKSRVSTTEDENKFFARKLSLNETQHGKQIKEALDIIFPPRTFEDGDNLWIQNVSTNPATAATIINLEEQLNLELRQRRARETGICNIRRELYDQCFDELIREETIMLPERGLLLSKLKDELNMTLCAYKTLYESSIAYGIRKVLQVEKDKVDKEAQMESIKKMKDDTYEHVNEMRKELSLAEKKMNEEYEIGRLKHEEEMKVLKAVNQNLKEQLEEVMMSMLE